MSVDDSTSSVNRRERICVLVIFGVPMLLALITVSITFMDVLGRNRYGFPFGLLNRDFLIAINAVLAALASAVGELFRRGSTARRVAGGVIFSVLGLAIFFLSLYIFSGLFGVH